MSLRSGVLLLMTHFIHSSKGFGADGKTAETVYVKMSGTIFNVVLLPLVHTIDSVMHHQDKSRKYARGKINMGESSSQNSHST